MREALERVREGSDWDTKFRQMPLGKGIGIGCGFFISGSGLPIHWDPNRFPHATVHIQIDMDGGVTVIQVLRTLDRVRPQLLHKLFQKFLRFLLR